MSEPTKEELTKKLLDIILEYDPNAWKRPCDCNSMTCPGYDCVFCYAQNTIDSDRHDEDCILVIARQIRKMGGTLG